MKYEVNVVGSHLPNVRIKQKAKLDKINVRIEFSFNISKEMSMVMLRTPTICLFLSGFFDHILAESSNQVSLSLDR